MKQLTYIFLCVTLLATACSSPEESIFETEVGTATIEGKLTFNKDQTDATKIVPAPGAKVKITYSSSDLTYGTATGVSISETVLATADDDGRFTVTVPAIARETTYSVQPLDYLTEYHVSDGGTGFETKTGYYEVDTPVDTDASEGQTVYVAIEYDFVSEF